MTGKAMRFPLTYKPTGERLYWTARRVMVWHVGVPLRKPTKGMEWTYTDHEGYERAGGKTWLDCVDAIRVTAEGYDCTTTVS
jgi:hypothetical protein